MSGSRTRRLAIFFAILAVGSYLRCEGLDRDPLSNDEAFSWQMTRFSTSQIVSSTRFDANPPLYYLVLSYWSQAAGTTPVMLRLLSAGLGVLSIGLAYGATVQLARSIKLETAASIAGLLAATLIAVHPFHVSLDRVVRAYALAGCLGYLSTLLFARFLTCGGNGWLIAYALSCTTFAYAHYSAALVLSTHFFFGWAHRLLSTPVGGPRIGLRDWMKVGLVFGLVYGPWVHSLWLQTVDVRIKFWTPPVASYAVFDLFVYYFTWIPAANEFFPLACIGLVAVVIGLTWRYPLAGVGLGIFAIVPWLTLLGISFALSRNLIVDRYLVSSHGQFLCVLAICGISVHNRFLKTLFALVAILNLTAAYIRPPTDSGAGGYQELAIELSAHYQPDQLIITHDAGAALRTDYYLTQRGIAANVQVRGQVEYGSGHQTHAIAINTERWLSPSAIRRLSDRTIWTVSYSANGLDRLPSHWQVESLQVFLTPENTSLYLIKWRIP